MKERAETQSKRERESRKKRNKGKSTRRAGDAFFSVLVNTLVAQCAARPRCQVQSICSNDECAWPSHLSCSTFFKFFFLLHVLARDPDDQREREKECPLALCRDIAAPESARRDLLLCEGNADEEALLCHQDNSRRRNAH